MVVVYEEEETPAESTSEAKEEAKAEVKEEAKAEAKEEAKAEAKEEAKAEAKEEAKAEAKEEAKAEDDKPAEPVAASASEGKKDEAAAPAKPVRIRPYETIGLFLTLGLSFTALLVLIAWFQYPAAAWQALLVGVVETFLLCFFAQMVLDTRTMKPPMAQKVMQGALILLWAVVAIYTPSLLGAFLAVFFGHYDSHPGGY